MKNNKIVRNASWIIGCKIAETFFMLLITVFQARIFGPVNFGVITYAQSIVTIAVPVMQLGLNTIMVKELVGHEDSEGEIVGTALGMSMISAPISILAVFIFTFFVNAGATETIIVCVLYSVLLLFQVFEILQYWFLSKYMSKITSIIIFVSYVVTSLYKLAILFINKNVKLYAISQALYYAIIAILFLIFYKRSGGQKLKFSLSRAKDMFSRSKFYLLSSLAVTIYTQIDRVILKNVVGDAENAFYAAAITIVNMATFIFTAIVDSSNPDLVNKRMSSKEEFENGMVKLYSVVIYLSLLMCVFVDIFAPLIIKIMYGSEYIPSISLLRIVVWYGMFSFIGIARTVYIVIEKKEKYICYISIFGAIFSVIVNYCLVNLIGTVGAAITAVLTQILVNIVSGFIVKPIRENNKYILKAVNPKNVIDLLKSFFAKADN